MDKNDLKNLEEALKRSPNNIGLRLNYALKLFKLKEFDSAEKNYQHVLKISADNIKAKQGLIEVYFAKKNFSAVIVIAEELVNKNIASEKILELYAKSLLRQNNVQEAQEVYDKLITRNPFYFDEELDSALDDKDEYLDIKDDEFGYELGENEEFGQKQGDDLEDFLIDNFLGMGEHLFLEEKNIHLGDVVGLDEAKQVLRHKLSFINRDEKLASTYNLRSTGGILLFGPYGCGKTHIIKTIPYEFDCKVLPYEMFRLTDPWSFKQEGMMHYFYNFARANMPCVLFFDELDGLIFDRNLVQSNADRVVISKFLTEMDSVRQNNEEVVIIAATNAPWKLDPALLRYGRFDSILFLPPPTSKERGLFLEKKLSKVKNNLKNLDKLIELTKNFSYAEIEQLFDQTTMKLMTSKPLKTLPTINEKDLMENLEGIIPTFASWYKQFELLMPSYLEDTVIGMKVRKYVELNK